MKYSVDKVPHKISYERITFFQVAGQKCFDHSLQIEAQLLLVAQTNLN